MTKAVANAKSKAGRPRKERLQLHLDVIEDKAIANTLDEIAAFLRISSSTLDRWLEHSDVRAAYDRGRAIAKDEMTKNLYRLAMEGSVPATIFWLKAQAGWTDKLKPEESNASQVVFYLPENGR